MSFDIYWYLAFPSQIDDVDVKSCTDRQPNTQNDYCNPRCACAPRLNEVLPETNVQGDHEPIAISPEENADSVQDMQDKSVAGIEKPALESNNKNEQDLIPTAATVEQSQSPLKVYPTRDGKLPDRFEPKF